MAAVKAGDHVWADFGKGKVKVLAHVLDDGHETDGDGIKHAIQNPATGDSEDLGYREPDDRDAGGSGRTFWTIK